MTVRRDPALPDHTVGAARNAIRILRYLAAAGAPVRLTPMARDLQLHASHCLNLLRTLADQTMVLHDPVAKTYAIGIGVLTLAQCALSRHEAPQLVQPLLDAFSRRHRVSVMLWRRVADDELMVMARSVQGATLHISADLGTRLPLLTGSMGHVVGGSGLFEQAELRRHFDAIDWQRDSDFAAFLEESAKARRQGWYLGGGGGWQGLSVLVPSPPGGPLRIVNAAILSTRQADERLERLVEELIALAATLGGVEARSSGPLATTGTIVDP